jgi:pilus assembly protein Flp/PilA
MECARTVNSRRGHSAGQGLAEYALILALIAVLVIGALTLVGGGIADTLSTISNAL